MSIRDKLPYTWCNFFSNPIFLAIVNVSCSAAIKEIQRCANIVGVNVPHRTVRDTNIGPFEIPADTLVIGQIHNVLANSPVFEDTEQFRPERFLLEDGVTPNKV
ncbi:hypothetical protein ANCDUO_08846 [Ancylostoma duodenale]|uniref:Uncharacterized protein n=1 Tax=Ancylostoma duodenale TaxID=51022 RepID=A0A0C2CVJ0_9BILA|nr:hypothetical protein ANCDUO_08846 [Ancylostoma duodenale]